MSKIQTTTKFTFLGMFIWLLAAFCFLYDFFLKTFLGTVIPELTIALHVNAAQISLLDSAYFITYGAMQIPAGILIDRYGVKLLLTFATCICSCGILIFSGAHSFWIAFIGRMFMGFGSSFAFICLLTLTLHWLPRKFSGLFFGLAQFLGAIGPILASAPLAILLFRLHDNWRLAFIIISLAGFLLAICIGFFVRSKPQANMKSALLRQTGPLHKQLTALIYNRQAWFVMLYSATIYPSVALLGTLWGPTYLATRFMSHTMATFTTSMLWLGLALGCPMVGFISDLLQHRKSVLISCASLGIITTIAILYAPFNNSWFLLLLFFLLGISGAGQSIGFNTITENVEDKLHATALGFNNGMISLSNIIFVLLIGVIIHLSFHGHFIASKTSYHLANFTLGLSFMPLLFIAALIFATFFIKETYCRIASWEK